MRHVTRPEVKRQPLIRKMTDEGFDGCNLNKELLSEDLEPREIGRTAA
jgi:hypothetical protein